MRQIINPANERKKTKKNSREKKLLPFADTTHTHNTHTIYKLILLLLKWIESFVQSMFNNITFYMVDWCMIWDGKTRKKSNHLFAIASFVNGMDNRLVTKLEAKVEEKSRLLNKSNRTKKKKKKKKRNDGTHKMNWITDSYSVKIVFITYSCLQYTLYLYVSFDSLIWHTSSINIKFIDKSTGK